MHLHSPLVPNSRERPRRYLNHANVGFSELLSDQVCFQAPCDSQLQRLVGPRLYFLLEQHQGRNDVRTVCVDDQRDLALQQSISGCFSCTCTGSHVGNSFEVPAGSAIWWVKQ